MRDSLGGRPRVVLVVVLATLMLALASPCLANALADDYAASWQGPDGREYLGRWPDGTVPWVYNPAGAPEELQDAGRVSSLIREAMRQWEGVCGVRFEYRGTTDVPIWKSVPGAVLFGWGGGRGDGAAAEAGPAWSATPSEIIAKGYLPFTDGRVRLARLFDWSDGNDTYTAARALAVLVHEVGHVIGLTHGREPWSVMFASPYTNLLYPRAVDAAAAQNLYGPPKTPLVIPRYTPPPEGALRATGVWFAREEAREEPLLALSGPDEAGPGDVGLCFALPDAPAGRIEVVLVDPSGVFHSGRSFAHAGGTVSGLVGLMPADALASLAGTWTAYVLFDGKTAGKAELRTGQGE